METPTTTSEVNIHLRARTGDRDLIDQAAGLIGASRTQFILNAALKEAKGILLDQTTIRLSAASLQQLLAEFEREPSPEVRAGIQRLLTANIFTPPSQE